MTFRPTEIRHRRLRRLNSVSSLAGIAPVGILLVVTESDTWWAALVVSLGVAAAVVTAARWGSAGFFRVALPCLVVAAVVWLLGVLVTGSPVAYFGVCVVGALLLPQLPRHRIWASAALVGFVAAVGAAGLLVSGEDTRDTVIAYILAPAGVTAFVTALLFVSQIFWNVLSELEQAREGEAELAVSRERIRFASDLHDIQGHTLHVVKLKLALAQKLVHTDPDRAAEELREIHDLVGDTITQTKDLAYAQRRLNLPAELENAKNLFEAAGIAVYVERESEADPRAAELLGLVLRETTTNILRHAEARRVRITLSRAGIAIANDGALEAPEKLRGLATLRERVASDGGELTVEQRDGNFLTAAAFGKWESR